MITVEGLDDLSPIEFNCKICNKSIIYHRAYFYNIECLLRVDLFNLIGNADLIINKNGICVFTINNSKEHEVPFTQHHCLIVPPYLDKILGYKVYSENRENRRHKSDKWKESRYKRRPDKKYF